MNKDYHSDDVSTETDYVKDVRPSTRKILYSFTHGVVSIASNPDDLQHIFLGLGTVGFDDFGGIPPEKWVQYSHLSTYPSYTLVFINACHSGDAASGYTDSQSRSSVAGNFKGKFPNAVYIACRGGKNSTSINPVVNNCTKCLGETLAKNMALGFFTKIREEWDDGQNPTFNNIKEEWDPEDDPNPASSHYIMYGGNTYILSVFPK